MISCVLKTLIAWLSPMQFKIITKHGETIIKLAMEYQPFTRNEATGHIRLTVST